MFSLHGTCKPDPCSLAHWGLEKKLHFTLFPECAAVTPVFRGGFCGQGLSSWWQAHVVLPATKFRWQRERTMSLLSLSVCQLVKPNESATCHSWCHLCQLSAQILIDLFWISQQPQGRGHRWNVHTIVGGRCLFSFQQSGSKCVEDGRPFQTRTLSLFLMVVLFHFVLTRELDYYSMTGGEQRSAKALRPCAHWLYI